MVDCSGGAHADGLGAKGEEHGPDPCNRSRRVPLSVVSSTRLSAHHLLDGVGRGQDGIPGVDDLLHLGLGDVGGERAQGAVESGVE